ncbi:hypothetical protein BGX28_009012 [Mortierella sp. GBA30]|nr:hypothetical protein BGX28_009012 [Mortierella sp. GBA30]
MSQESQRTSPNPAHRDHEAESDAEDDQIHNFIHPPRRPLDSASTSTRSASISHTVSTADSSAGSAAAPSNPTMPNSEDVSMEEQPDSNTIGPEPALTATASSWTASTHEQDLGSSGSMTEVALLWPSSSDREQTSLSTLSTVRRYPSLTLRTAQYRGTQSPNHRHMFIPLPEREDSSRPRPRSITFGTLKKASMSSRSTSSISTSKQSKMSHLPAYLRHTTFVQHFQPEGLADNDLSATSPTEREPSKRRRLLVGSGRRRRTHLHLDSDSSSYDSSSSSSSGSESGKSAHENDGMIPTSVRRPLKYHLPSRWSSVEKTEKTMLFEDDLEVHYTGPGKADSDASAIRANRPIPPQCGVYYYEVFIKSKGQQGYIGVGVCNSSVPLDRLPGWEPQSWGYHGDDGNIFGGCGNGRPFGPMFTTGDTIGCGVNFRDMSLFYTKNGKYLGVAFRDLKGSLYPTVGMRTAGEIVEANFGQQDFIFDMESYVKELKMEACRELEDTFQRTIDEKNQVGVLSQSLSQLVLSYMIHHGYSESAKQFSRDLVPPALRKGGSSSGFKDSESHPLVVDTERRKVIRTAILAGDIDKAIDLLEKHYPGIVATQEDMLLQLRCRKFVEMVSSASFPLPALDNSKRLQGSSEEKQDMEMIEGNSSMDVDQDTSSQKGGSSPHTGREPEDFEGLGPLKDAIQYGQFLQEQYKHNRRTSVQEMLINTFSVLAYSDNERLGSSSSTTGAGTLTSKQTKFLRPVTRETVADAVNTAILASQNLPTTAPLETVYRHTNVILSELTRQGVGEAAFFDLHKDCLE